MRLKQTGKGIEKSSLGEERGLLSGQDCSWSRNPQSRERGLEDGIQVRRGGRQASGAHRRSPEADTGAPGRWPRPFQFISWWTRLRSCRNPQHRSGGSFQLFKVLCSCGGCRLKSCADAFEGIFPRCRGVFAT